MILKICRKFIELFSLNRKKEENCVIVYIDSVLPLTWHLNFKHISKLLHKLYI